VSVGRQTAFPTPLAPLSVSELSGGVSFILHDNLWDTNYPAWYAVCHVSLRSFVRSFAIVSYPDECGRAPLGLAWLGPSHNDNVMYYMNAVPMLSDLLRYPWLSGSEVDSPMGSGDDRFRLRFEL
jgi:hypothetical protein